ncbi:MAG: peptidylprolyl isomerase [Acidobacteriota bacterium]|nr:peptidylprolyl isomerase [Acidobacteriota bacterium]
MSHQETKTQGRQMGKWADGQIAKTLPPARPPLHPTSCLPAHLPICLLLALLVASPAVAQVAAHAPVVIQPATESGVILRPVGRPVVRVNGAVLTDRDLLREMFTIFPYARTHNGFPREMEAGIRDGAMKMIIFEELVYQEAKRRNMTVPPAELAHAQAEFRQQFSSSNEYQQFLQAEFHGSEPILRAKIERSLLIDKLLKQEVTSKAVVSVAEAKAYYNQHPERFNSPESFSFQSISILPPPNATAAQLSEARQRAASALRQAKATKNHEEFGLLAQKISEDDFRVMMGDHKAADRSKLPPPVVKALAAMQPSQVSDIVEFDAHDYTILRLTAHIPSGMQQFETVKDKLLGALTKDKNEQLRSALATKLSRNAKIEKA